MVIPGDVACFARLAEVYHEFGFGWTFIYRGVAVYFIGVKKEAVFVDEKVTYHYYGKFIYQNQTCVNVERAY